jgi:peroxisomal membrane protein 4
MDAIQQVIMDPQYHEYLAILKGARNGIVYGAKVRFPHALVMAILFGRGEYVHDTRIKALKTNYE